MRFRRSQIPQPDGDRDEPSLPLKGAEVVYTGPEGAPDTIVYYATIAK